MLVPHEFLWHCDAFLIQNREQHGWHCLRYASEEEGVCKRNPVLMLDAAVAIDDSHDAAHQEVNGEC